MLFTIVSVTVPALVFVLAPILLRAGAKYRWLLMVACLVFFVSWYLPSPRIDGMQTQFVTHFIGGGVFSGLLWLYIKLVKKWQSSWWVEATTLYALVSALGVANELFEFVFFKAGHMPHGLADTSYDLVANTLGAGVVFLLYVMLRKMYQVVGRLG